MAEPNTRPVLSGAGLVWKRQRVLWWIFVFNLGLAFLSTRALSQDAGAVLNHSLESSRRLVHGFDISAMSELGELPQDPLRAVSSAFTWPSILFTIFMLFMTGGVLTSYYEDLRLNTAELFEACGRHFWRFLRLMIYFAIVMIPIGILATICGKLYSHIDDVSISPFSSAIFIGVAGLVILLLLLSVRLWFDIAQVVAVAEAERRMHKALRRSARLVWRNFGSLFWLYLRISIVAWIVFGFALYVWMRWLKPESTTLAFILGQLLILWWLGARLWQRASGVEWYKGYQELPGVAEASPAPTAPLPLEEEVPVSG